MGAFVAGLSLISNLAAGVDDAPLDHQEVLAAGRRSEARIAALLERVAPLLVAVE
jgi:purine-nucleoside phosphorylase